MKKKSLEDIWNTTPSQEKPSGKPTLESIWGAPAKKVEEVSNVPAVQQAVASLPEPEKPTPANPFAGQELRQAKTPRTPLTAKDVTEIGNQQTIQLFRKKPELVSPLEHLKAGMSFGQNLSKHLPGYEDDIGVDELPEPKTLPQKVARGIGETLTFFLAAPVIEATLAAGVSKVPHGKEILSLLKEASGPTAPFVQRYGISGAKTALTGGILGLAQNNKESLAKNALDTAGMFAAFHAIAYPLGELFRPVFQSVGQSTVVPAETRILAQKTLSNMEKEQTKSTLYFRNPNDETQILKVTATGLKPTTSKEVVEAGTKVTDIPVITQYDIEAFKQQPSIFNKLRQWISGGKIKDTPFEAKNVESELDDIIKQVRTTPEPKPAKPKPVKVAKVKTVDKPVDIGDNLEIAEIASKNKVKISARPEENNTIHIDRVDSLEKGLGNFKKTLDDLIKYAQESKKRITTTPGSDFSKETGVKIETAKLEKTLREKGFVENPRADKESGKFVYDPQQILKDQNKLDKEYTSELNALANRSSIDDMAFGNFEKKNIALKNRIYGKDRLMQERNVLSSEIEKIQNEPAYSTDDTAKRMVGARQKSIKMIDVELSGKEIPETKEGQEASLAEDMVADKLAPSKNPEELIKRIEQLNKFAQGRAILRRTGGLSKKHAGVFKSGQKVSKRGEVRLQDTVVQTPEQYLTTLAHELGHALEYSLVGKTNLDIYRVFGRDLSASDKLKIRNELKEITNRMVGEEAAKAKAGYYYKDTELLARFFERMFENPGDVAELAPTALDYLERSAVENPIIQEYLDAVYGNIDKGAAPFVFLRDMRQTYQKVLGNRVGDMVYKEEVSYRAMRERAKVVIEKFIKDKFKGIKDSPDALFKAAEGITFTENEVPQFGTRNFANAKNEKEAIDLINSGWQPLKDENGKQIHDVINDKEVDRFFKTRYTPEQGKRMYNDLSDEGKKLIREFTSRKDEARDLFNRDLIKTIYKIEGDVEGWVHHYFDEEISGTVMRSRKFKEKVAGTRKQRTGTEGYVEDFQKAMTKALTDLEGEKVWNEFIEKQFARVTKPIAKGSKPDDGWTEVVGNLKKGIGTAREKKMVIIKDGEAIPAQQTRYQMPTPIYERYKLMSEVAVETSKAMRVINSINRYWRVNILFHPGSAATNLISGGVQYTTKILTDFYTEVLTGSLKFQKTRRNLFSMLTVLTPKGWQAAPDWIYGSDLSNYYGQFGTLKAPGVLDKSVDAYADKALKVYGMVERYWKKVISTAENVGDLERLTKVTREGLAVPTEEERLILNEINREIDLFAYDYDNVPMWLENYQQHPLLQTFKPFLKYPYKYSKQIADMVGSVFDRTKPWQERMAKLLAIGTIIGIYAHARNKRKEQQTTPEVPETAPASVSTRGRLFVGTDREGNEIFTRVAKYPFINITETGSQFIEGNTHQGFQSIADLLGGVAPGGKLALLLLGVRNEFEQYTPAPVLIGDNIASFVPGTRILSDVARFFDPYQRSKKTFGQSFTSLIPFPTTDEDLRAKMRGKARVIAVPEEGEITGAEGKRTTVDMLVRNYRNDILLSTLTGIYQTRIDPDVAKAFIIRKKKNEEKKAKKAKK